MALDPQTRQHYDRIAREMGDDRFFTRRELDTLPGMLQRGEEVLAFASGVMEAKTWLIVLTGRRIIFLNKGLFFGLKHVTVDLMKVNSVESKTGLLFGTITVHDGGTGYTIEQVLKHTVGPFTRRADRAVAALRSGPPPSLASGDRLSQLERLGALRSGGVITEAEFQAEKARILAS